jgi:putative SOS response-associated peptidase YedK
MCGRYSLADTEKLTNRFHIDDYEGEDISPNYNVAPTQVMPVVTEDDEGRHIEFMRWGIPRFIREDTVKELINTRAEKAFGRFWSKQVLSQRVLIPATSFYEWQIGSKPKKPFLIHPKTEEVFAFAGIRSTWKDKDGKEWKVYSIMTTTPNKEMKGIHNRMPVILHRKDEEAWLSPSNNGDKDFIESLLRPYDNNGLEMWEVSRDVNVARNNNGELIKPINSQ